MVDTGQVYEGCLILIGKLCLYKIFTDMSFWAVQRPLGSMFVVPWYEMSYVNVLRRFGDFCTALCTAQRLNINPCLTLD